MIKQIANFQEGAGRLCANILVLATVFILQPSVGAAGELTAKPIDEAINDPSFLAFREMLIEAIVKRDSNYIISQSSSDIKLSHGGHSGRQDFKSFLTLSEDDLADEYKHEAAKRRESYWDSIEEVLRSGGKFTRPGFFEAPYTWTYTLRTNSDPYTTFFVRDSNVPLRDRPSKYGNIIRSLNYNIVSLLPGGAGTSYMRVEVMPGQTGYVHEDQIRSATDYRAAFEKKNDRWQIVSFIAGD